MAGYFITHDIYEEWALEKFIEIKHIRSVNNRQFLDSIGQSLQIRRSVRNWLSDKLYNKESSIIDLVNDTFNSDDIDSFWKDEILVSVLLSEYSNDFFEIFKEKLLQDNCTSLKRMCFLLRIACKEVDKELIKKIGIEKIKVNDYYFTKPIGFGWESIINFVYENIDSIDINKISFILPVLKDWNNKYHEGETTKYASLIALKYYQNIIDKKIFWNKEELEREIISTIVYGSKEITLELSKIVSEIIEKNWKKHNDPYEELCKYCLENIGGYLFTRSMPTELLRIAKLFWTKDGEVDNYGRLEIEDYFKIERSYQNYYPSSAVQTPIYNLLRVSFNETLDFIIDFANETGTAYLESTLSENEKFKVNIFYNEDCTKERYVSHRLWCMYRGTQRSTELLESIHMALEKRLLEIGRIMDGELLTKWLKYILEKAQTESLTAIVCSIVNAYPDKTFEIAKILFKTKEFFHFDKSRADLDIDGKRMMGFDYGINNRQKQHIAERNSSFEDENRKISLEDTFLSYLLIQGEGLSEEKFQERAQELYEILDNYYAEIKGEYSIAHNNWRMVLSKMDLRKMKVEEVKVEEGTLLKLEPIIDKKLKAYKNNELKRIEYKFKYIKLENWAELRLKSNEKYKEFIEYEENIQLAFDQLIDIISIIEQENEEELYLFHSSLPYKICVILLRDFNDEISKENKLVCIEIIMKAIGKPFAENYGYQVNDGVELSYSNINLVLKEAPRFEKDILEYLILTLLDDTSLGGYGNFSQYAVNPIREFLLLEKPELAETIVFGYMYLAPIYDKYEEEKREKIWKGNKEHLTAFEMMRNFRSVFEKEINRVIDGSISISEISNIKQIDNLILGKAFNLISDREYSSEISKMQRMIIDVFATTFFEKDDEKISYTIQDNFFRDYTKVVLLSSDAQRINLINPFLENFCCKEGLSELFTAFFINAETFGCYENFWKVWQLFKDAVISSCDGFDPDTVKHDYNYRLQDEMIKGFLLINRYWNDEITTCKVLKPKDYLFFEDFVKMLPNYPAVIHSVARLINGIGSIYSKKGITWMAQIIEVGGDAELRMVDEDTALLIEAVVKKYILINRSEIKKHKRMMDEILIILNWLVERGSATGYLVREDII